MSRIRAVIAVGTHSQADNCLVYEMFRHVQGAFAQEGKALGVISCMLWIYWMPATGLAQEGLWHSQVSWELRAEAPSRCCAREMSPAHDMAAETICPSMWCPVSIRHPPVPIHTPAGAAVQGPDSPSCPLSLGQGPSGPGQLVSRGTSQETEVCRSQGR